jgi:REP element-mobilizing transposase RayT
MGRARRTEVAGGLYHVTSRGNDGRSIVLDNADRIRWLALRRRCEESYGWTCHAYCLMSTHFHLLLETADATLASGMHWLNHVYAKSFNRRHGCSDHVFGRRYFAKVVTSDEQLVATVRYIALNPVDAGLVSDPAEWPWCNFGDLGRLAFGRAQTPPRAYGRLIADGARLAAQAIASR